MDKHIAHAQDLTPSLTGSAELLTYVVHILSAGPGAPGAFESNVQKEADHIEKRQFKFKRFTGIQQDATPSRTRDTGKGKSWIERTTQDM
jgi:hypothetical protein